MLQPKRGFLSALASTVIVFVAARLAQPIFNFEVERVWDKTVVPFLTENAPAWVATVAEYLGSFWGGAFTILAVWGCVEAVHVWRRYKSATPKTDPDKVREVARECVELSRTILKDNAHWEQIAPVLHHLATVEENTQHSIQDWDRRRKQTTSLSAAYSPRTISLLYALEDLGIVRPDFDPSIPAAMRRPFEFELEWQLPFVARYFGVIGDALERGGLEAGQSASARWVRAASEANRTDVNPSATPSPPPPP